MNAFEKLLTLSVSEKEKKGVVYTPAEIAQQPAVWAKTADRLGARRREIRAFLTRTGLQGRRRAILILTGAGSSEFIGNAVLPVLRTGLRREVLSLPTTHLVTHLRDWLVPGHPYVVLSFARSGNSPESLATFEQVRAFAAALPQIVITCHRNGALAKAARADRKTLLVELPPETNDRSLVMTSSFSAMALAAVGLSRLAEPDRLTELATQLGAGARRLMTQYGDVLRDFARLPFTRACYLGSGALYGTMQECHLKMLEMTEGRVASRFDSFLGVRHGPQVFINRNCAVIAALSSNPRIRPYELDLLKSLKRQRQGCGTLVICDRATWEIRALASHLVELYPDGKPVPDFYRIMTDVMAGQMVALFKCLALGLKPDAPCTTGAIHRVVQGVTIYDET